MSDRIHLNVSRHLDVTPVRRRLRSLHAAPQGKPLPPGRIAVAGRVLCNFASNDYLGLSRHPLLRERADEWNRLYGCGSGGSRLTCGNVEPLARVEEKLTRFLGRPQTLIFSSGYQANAAILPALLSRHLHGAKPLIFCDRLNHASLHAGIQAAGLRQIRYRHNDIDHLSHVMKTAPDAEAKSNVKSNANLGPPACFIISETVFSMDGDRADIESLVSLAARYDAFLYLDEAHALGVLGPRGAGLAADHSRADIVLGTFGKALGCFGAYAGVSPDVREFLINHCPGFIYTTALPPGVLGAVDAALDLVPAMDDARSRILSLAQYLRQELNDIGFDCGHADSHIVPVIIGGEGDALAVSAALEAAGLLAMAIRPPTVPQGASRIRLSITAAHSQRDIDDVIAALKRIGPTNNHAIPA